MRTILLAISLISLIVGCDNKKTNDARSLEEERQKNIAAVISAPVDVPQKPIVPKFILACSTGGGQPWYRIASNGTDIFYASVLNENNLRATKKSFEVDVTEREINVKLRSGEEDTTYFMEIDRSSLFVTTKYFVSKQMYPPEGFYEMGLNCQTIDDAQLLATLKNAYETTFSEAVEKKRQYENRPNKI